VTPRSSPERADAPTDLVKMGAMRVISWNMGMADRSRRFVNTHDQAWRYLLGLTPDLAFLQETLPPDWVEDEGRVVRNPFQKWGSLVFSPRLAIERFALRENNSLLALPNYLVPRTVPSRKGGPSGQWPGAPGCLPPRRFDWPSEGRACSSSGIGATCSGWPPCLRTRRRSRSRNWL